MDALKKALAKMRMIKRQKKNCSKSPIKKKAPVKKPAAKKSTVIKKSVVSKKRSA